MSPEHVMNLARHAMEITLLISAPILLTALAVGLLVSIFQAATQIQEATLSFIPKLLGILLVLVIAGPWMLSVMTEYMYQVLTDFPITME
jgi:flagellar biosynthetic protein FliQ